MNPPPRASVLIASCAAALSGFLGRSLFRLLLPGRPARFLKSFLGPSSIYLQDSFRAIESFSAFWAIESFSAQLNMVDAAVKTRYATPGMSKNRYSVVVHYTNNLVFDRIASGLLKELQSRTPKNEKGQRPNKLHQWFTEDVGDPMLAQHLHSIVMLQRLAIANSYGWNRFLHMVDQVLPRRGDTLPLPLPAPNELEHSEAAN